jgi:hypothetical protein
VLPPRHPQRKNGEEGLAAQYGNNHFAWRSAFLFRKTKQVIDLIRPEHFERSEQQVVRRGCFDLAELWPQTSVIMRAKVL